jgi:hypothetical protein
MPILFMGLLAWCTFLVIGILCIVAVRSEGREQRNGGANAAKGQDGHAVSPCCRTAHHA